MQEITTKILPIFIFIILGYFVRRFKIIDERGITGIKKIIMNIALPMILFINFLGMELKPEYLIVITIAIIFYFSTYAAARLIRRIKGFNFRLLPYLSSGYAFALIGIPLFQIVFGAEHLDSLSILGVANELYVWILLFTFLKIDLNNERFTLTSVRRLVTSPMILSIAVGLLLNLFGAREFILENFITRAFYNTADMISAIASPLILSVIGYGIVINKRYLKESVKYVAVRLALLFVLGYSFKLLIFDRLINDIYFDFAFFTLLTLPPPLLIQVFASDYCEKETAELGNNVIVVSIVTCVILFIGYALIVSALGLI